MANDVERILAVFSEDFSNAQGANKAVLRGFFEAAISQGVFGSLEMSMEDCEIVVDRDSATASPVIFTTYLGSASYSYKMKREANGVWRITNSELIN